MPKAKVRRSKPHTPTLKMPEALAGFVQIWTKEGNGREPIYFAEPNLIVHNTTNDLYRYARKGKDEEMKILRILPWLARATVYANSRRKGWSIERFNMEVDRATRYYLTQMGEIS